VPFKDSFALAGREYPKSKRFVFTGRNQMIAVQRKANGGYSLCVSGENLNALSSREVPHSHRGVTCAGNGKITGLADGCRRYTTFVT